MLRGGCPSRCARLVGTVLYSSAFLYCLLCNHIYRTLALIDEPAFPEAAGCICFGAALCSIDIHMCPNGVKEDMFDTNFNFAALSTSLTSSSFVGSVGESISVR